MKILLTNIRNTDYSLALASSPEAIKQTNALVELVYATRGYSTDVLDSTHVTTFAILKHEKVVGTLSIRFDSEEGLLSDQYFHEELTKLRAEGYKLCEFTKLAFNDIRSTTILAVIFHAAYSYSWYVKHSSLLVIEVNPRHAKYYISKLGFKPLSEEKFFAELNGPASLLHLNLEFMHELLADPNACICIDKTLYKHRLTEEEEQEILTKVKDAI